MNRGEIYLIHKHEGIDLKLDWAKDVLNQLNKLWTRPVHLETMVQGKVRVFTANGEVKEKEVK
jgi:stage V sporulation protein R